MKVNEDSNAKVSTSLSSFPSDFLGLNAGANKLVSMFISSDGISYSSPHVVVAMDMNLKTINNFFSLKRFSP